MKKCLSLILAVIILLTLCSCGNKRLSNLSGDYIDQVSERATMTLERRDDKDDPNMYDIKINWPVSSFEGVYWTMSGEFDGYKIAYKDGECHIYTYDESGNLTKDEIDGTDLEGNLTLEIDNRIEWSGSDVEESALFIMMPEEDKEKETKH